MNNREFIQQNKSFIKQFRGKATLELLAKRLSAFGLLTLIAQRARRTDDPLLDDLEIGQAYVGDYESYGVTEQIYRTDKIFLKKYGFSTFKSTNKGTIATLCDNSIYDTNPTNKPTTKPTDSQRPTNEQLTTNKNDKNVKNDKNIYIQDFELKEIADKFSISLKDTQATYDQMMDWCSAKGKTYKDYKAGLRNWIHKRIEDGKIKVIIKEAEITDPLLKLALGRARQ